MLTDGNLTKFTLRLTVRGPVFIGSGREVSKKEYSFNPRTQEITFYGTQKLLECIVQNELTDAYEDYMLGSARSLYDFIRANGGAGRFTAAQSYKIMGGDAIFGEGGQPADIRTFIRGADGKPYIPGSSVKGMLRTAITAALVQEKAPRTAKPKPPALDPHDRSYKRVFQKEASFSARALDTELFNKLNFDTKRIDNAVNSVFRGLIVADSKPLGSQALVLCRKLDLHPQGNTNQINLVRECLRPGVAVDIPITIDRTLAGDITAEFIAQAVSRFDRWYTDNVFPHYEGCRFPLPRLTHHLFLGGGSGYQSKTVTGPWLGEDVQDYIYPWLVAQFGNKNRADTKLGISPHMLKYTAVDRQKLLFGLCEVNIL